MAKDIIEELEGELFVWSESKDALNRRKHRLRLRDAMQVFFDDDSWSREDETHPGGETRYVRIGIGTGDRVLVVVYTYRDDMVRIISVRPAAASERKAYEERT